MTLSLINVILFNCRLARTKSNAIATSLHVVVVCFRNPLKAQVMQVLGSRGQSSPWTSRRYTSTSPTPADTARMALSRPWVRPRYYYIYNTNNITLSLTQLILNTHVISVEWEIPTTMSGMVLSFIRY